MRYWNYILALRTELAILFLFSLSTIFVIDFWLINIPELFHGGAKLGTIVYRLSLSYISAFIFYFLVVHLKNQKDKETLYSYISGKVRMVIGSGTGMISELAKEAKVDLKEEFPTSDELNSICKKINPNSKAPLIIGEFPNYANWLQYMAYSKNRSNHATEKIFIKIHFLESALVKILADIEDCGHFGVLSHSTSTPVRNTDLTAWESEIRKYLELVKILHKYFEKNLKRYK